MPMHQSGRSWRCLRTRLQKESAKESAERTLPPPSLITNRRLFRRAITIIMAARGVIVRRNVLHGPTLQSAVSFCRRYPSCSPLIWWQDSPLDAVCRNLRPDHANFRYATKRGCRRKMFDDSQAALGGRGEKNCAWPRFDVSWPISLLKVRRPPRSRSRSRAPLRMPCCSSGWLRTVQRWPGPFDAGSLKCPDGPFKELHGLVDSKDDLLLRRLATQVVVVPDELGLGLAGVRTGHAIEHLAHLARRHLHQAHGNKLIDGFAGLYCAGLAVNGHLAALRVDRKALGIHPARIRADPDKLGRPGRPRGRPS